MKEMDDHGMRRIMEEAGVLPRHTSPDNVILLEDDKMEIDLNSSKVQEAMKRSGMTLREVSPGIMTLYGDGVQTKRFLEDLGDVELAKRLLAKAGIKEVASITEGEILAALDDIDMQTWDEVHKITVELKGMIEEITTLEARVNAKKMVLKGMTNLWWGNIADKYPAVGKAQDSHIDLDNKCIRAGLVKR